MSLKVKLRLRPRSTGSINRETYRFFKLVMVGDSGVGKSCLLDKFLDSSSNNNFLSTIGVDIRCRDTVIKNVKVRVQVWDTGGQERYRPVLVNCYRGALGVILVFDVTNRTSFLNIRQWILEIHQFAPSPTVPKLLVGNKADLGERREVNIEEATMFADQNDMAYVEASVIRRSNIEKVFEELIREHVLS